MKNNFAKNLRKIRKAQKLSREQLAKKHALEQAQYMAMNQESMNQH